MIKAITKIEDIDKEYVNSLIEQIMGEIQCGDLLYSNEREFQNNLLERIKDDIKNKGIIARVEQFSHVNKDDNKERVDILIYDKENNYVVIELKYKKKAAVYEVSGSREILWNDGADDEGTFDYFWDIYRLETLKSHKYVLGANPKQKTISHHCKNFIAGYAIMITNEDRYWGFTDKDAAYIMKNQLKPTSSAKKSVTIKTIEWGFGPSCKKKLPKFTIEGRFDLSGYGSKIDLNSGKGYDCVCNIVENEKFCYYLKGNEIKNMKILDEYDKLLKIGLKDKLEFHSYITEV